MAELSTYTLESLRKDAEFVLYRGQREAEPSHILVVAPISKRPAQRTLRRLEHEYALRTRLDPDWAVLPLDLVSDHGRTVLVLDDPGGAPLNRLLEHPLDLASSLRIASGLATALAGLHAQGLIHKDIKPANILVDPITNRVWLTGFSIASDLPRERQAPEPPETIAGTLAYMAPEQTGRMNRSIDSRSDLYSLGVTLYEILTGSLPFTASDPMEWVHCHIARQPIPPRERGKEIPPALSAIILKLLAKTAEERYQTASGAESDLRRCLAEYETRGRVDEFPLGEHDTPDRLLIPEKLYGRAHEINTLLASFGRVVTSGTPELVLVSGYSGIGKSSVVNELQKVLVPPRGLFASGKFDQCKRDIPYATLTQACQSLIRPLLSKSETELRTWRDVLQEVLGPNGQLIVDLVPELKLILGQQPPVPDLPLQDAQRRFQLVFRRFISVFARREHPLALFLDDLQWLDAATLDFLQDLLSQPDVQYLMLIGAYRDNEVNSGHPLMRKLEAIRQTGAIVEEVILAPLTPGDLGQLIADALRCELERAASLAQVVYEKTAGNPFFAIQFISALTEEALLTFNHRDGRWCWDQSRIHAKGYTDNVVDLMVGKLNRLPLESQKALQQLACLGNSSEITTFSIVHGKSEDELHSDLREAVRLDFIVRLQDSYKYVHDRVQEAAYSLIPEQLRAETHLRIGRLLMAHTLPEKREEAIFEIVNQLNRGLALVISREERDQIAELNLIAGQRAMASSAYASALKYLTTGAALGANDCWERRHELTFALELYRSECEFLTGQLAAAAERLARLSSRATNTVELATVTCLRMEVYTSLDQSDRAVAVCLDYLRQLGIEWSPHPTEEEVRREYEWIWSQLGNRTIEELIDLPLMSDPVSIATLDVLTKVLPAALHASQANLFSMTACRAVNLSLERGHGDGSCVAYVFLGRISGSQFGDYKAGFQFGQLGYELVEKRGLKRFQARTYHWFAQFVVPWTKHVRASRDLMRRAFEAATKIGDLTLAAYSRDNLNTNLLAAGDPLAEAQRQAEHGLEFAKKTRFAVIANIIKVQIGLIRTLRDLTPKFGSFDDGEFHELQFESHFANRPAPGVSECWYWIRKLQARFFAGDYPSALDAAEKAQRLLGTSVAMFETAEHHFYAALSHAASYDSAESDKRQQHFEALVAHHRQLEVWAENCSENFENRAALVSAEIARIEGRDLDAMRLYEQAVRSAHANGFVHNEALANELAARFYLARGFEKIAHAYLQDARYCYLRWGATAKVRQLDELYPQLKEQEPVPGPTSTIEAAVEQLDLATVVKAMQAVSREIDLGKLIETLMEIAVEHAGAERGLLFLPRGPEHGIEAEATTNDDSVQVILRQAFVTPPKFPEAVVRYVIRTRESVILNDASAENPFSDDEYLRVRHSRSILCLPLVKLGELIGALYLENNLTPRVFTPHRLAVLELLASQAAISLENARLYADLRQENCDRSKAEEALRASEERMNLAAEAANLGMWEWDVVSDKVWMTDKGRALFGFAPDERLDSAAMIAGLHPEDRAARHAAIRRAIETHGEYAMEYRVLLPDGQVRWIAGRGRVEFGGGKPLRMRGVSLDITERKQAQDRFQLVVESSPNGIVLFNAQGHIVLVNTCAEKLFGYGREELIGQGIELLVPERFRGEHPAHRAGFHAAPAALAMGGGLELFGRRKDGTEFPVEIGSSPIQSQEGTLVLSVIVDISARKQAEAEARQHLEELAHLSRVAIMGEMAGSLAHELNQPLTGIVNNAGAGRRFIAKGHPDLAKLDYLLGAIGADGRRAGEIIRSIRGMVRKGEQVLDPVNLNDVIASVQRLARSDALGRYCALVTELDPKLPLVKANQVQLQQVLLNLVVNAFDAMRETPAPERRIIIRSERESDGRVRVSVRDFGSGLPAEEPERIFERFFSTKREGMGMGLAIARSIITSHGGEMEAANAQGGGAYVRFSLPVIPEGQEETREGG